MPRWIAVLCVCLICFFAGVTPQPLSGSETTGLIFPTDADKKQARTTLSLLLAALRSGRTEPLSSLLHPFEVFTPHQGWESTDMAQGVLARISQSRLPRVERYTLYSLREIAGSIHLKTVSRNMYRALDQRGLIALAPLDPSSPVFYLSRESTGDPWTLFGLDPATVPWVPEDPVIPGSWKKHPSPVCAGALPLPRDWDLRTAPAGEPDQFISPQPDHPPVIHCDSREFTGPITEFSLNWIRMILMSGNMRDVRLRLVRKGFRLDFSTPLGKGVLGILSRSSRLLFFSILVETEAWNSLRKTVSQLFSAWSMEIDPPRSKRN